MLFQLLGPFKLFLKIIEPWLCWEDPENTKTGVLYTPPCCPVGLRRTPSDPANSGGPCRTVRRTSNGFRWIPPQSATSPVKVQSSGLMAKNGRTGRTCQSIGLPLDFHRTSAGLLSKNDRLAILFTISVFSGSSWHNQGSIIFRTT